VAHCILVSVAVSVQRHHSSAEGTMLLIKFLFSWCLLCYQSSDVELTAVLLTRSRPHHHHFHLLMFPQDILLFIVLVYMVHSWLWCTYALYKWMFYFSYLFTVNSYQFIVSALQHFYKCFILCVAASYIQRCIKTCWIELVTWICKWVIFWDSAVSVRLQLSGVDVFSGNVVA